MVKKQDTVFIATFCLFKVDFLKDVAIEFFSIGWVISFSV
jgi:hypothetical protein